jgi:transcriptional regulator with XRE-family HTH domain
MKSFVIQYNVPTSLPWSEKLVSKLSEPSYRHAYMMEGVKTWIARQVRALREQRYWSQEDLGRKANKPQSAISRLEDPDYGKLTLQTLFDLAAAYDLPLLVQFVEWGDWLARMNDGSTAALEKESFSATALTDFGAGQIVVEPINQPLAIDQNPPWNFVSHPAANLGTSLLMGPPVSSTRAIPANAGMITVYGQPEQTLSIFEDTERDFEGLFRSSNAMPLEIVIGHG